MNSNQHPVVTTAFTPRSAEVQAVQFLGELDPDSSTPVALALARTSMPSRSPDLTLTGTFLGLPVREEPFRNTSTASIPAPAHATLHLAPVTELAVLVPTASGGQAAFPGDWIVQDAAGVFTVWSDEKFRAGFDAVSEESRSALSDGSGTLRYDGSGTGRYGSGDHWTDRGRGEGLDYPSQDGSFGVPQNAPFVPLGEDAPDAPIVPASQAFAATPSSDPIAVGSSFRILRADQSVDPVAHVVESIDGNLITYLSDGETLEVLREHVVPVKAEHDILA